jgi:PKD repeat protein
MRRLLSGWIVACAVLGLSLAGCDDDASSPSSSTTTLSVTIETGSPTAGRAPLEVAFRSSPKGGNGVYAYSWQFGDGTASSEQNPIARYGSGGVFTASLKVVSGDQIAVSNAIGVRVDSDLRLDCFIGETKGLVPHSVSFRGVPSGGTGSYSYRWTFGDGATSSERETVHEYDGAGTFAAKLVVTSGALQASCSDTVEVYDRLMAWCKANPVGDPMARRFLAKASFCYGDCEFVWEFGDGASGDGSSALTHTFATAGTYEATGRVRTGKLKDSCKVTVTVP